MYPCLWDSSGKRLRWSQQWKMSMHSSRSDWKVSAVLKITTGPRLSLRRQMTGPDICGPCSDVTREGRGRAAIQTIDTDECHVFLKNNHISQDTEKEAMADGPPRPLSSLLALWNIRSWMWSGALPEHKTNSNYSQHLQASAPSRKSPRGSWSALV